MSKTLLMMAAGTGGHVIPGLAIAKEMQARGWQVHWLGTTHGMENKLVPPKGLGMTCLNFSGLRGKGLLHGITGIGKLVVATLKTWGLLGKMTPDVVVGMGGYVTVPGGWATKLRKLPLVVVNADAALLLSNKTLAHQAQRVLFGFAGEDVQKLGEKAFVTGNPVRAEIAALASPATRYAGRSGALRVLVVGGSLGAKVLNDTLPVALALIPVAQRPIVTHQSGAQHVQSLQQAYDQAGVNAQVLPFIEDMAQAYAETDVLICRAGAMTVSEIAVAGVASILVPFVASTTAHQRDNAQWMEKQGAAIHLPQQALNPQALATLLQSLQRDSLQALAEKAKALGKPNATRDIADQIEQVVAA